MTSKQRIIVIVAMISVGLIIHLFIIAFFPPRFTFPKSIAESPTVKYGGGLLARDGDNVYFKNVNHDRRLYKMSDTASDLLSSRWGVSHIFLIGDLVFFKAQGLYSVDVNGNNSKAIDRRDVFDVVAIDDYVFYSAQTKGTWDNIRKIDMFCYNVQTGRRYLALENADIICITKYGIYFRHILDYGVDEKKNNTGYSARLSYIDFLSGEIIVISDELPSSMEANDDYVFYTSKNRGYDLYRANLDMSNPMWIAERPVGLYVTENYVFYWKNYLLVRSDLDGRNKRQIHDTGENIHEVVGVTERELLIWVRTGAETVAGRYLIMNLEGENIRGWLE